MYQSFVVGVGDDVGARVGGGVGGVGDVVGAGAGGVDNVVGAGVGGIGDDVGAGGGDCVGGVVYSTSWALAALASVKVVVACVDGV